MAETVDAYFDVLKNPKQHDDLVKLREFLQGAMPDAEEKMTYSMPHYWVGDQTVCGFASQKNYISLYMDMDVVEQHREKLGDLNCGKSCIRFKKIDDLPFDVIQAIIDDTIVKNAAE